MRTVILAGGLGTRLAEETEALPKPMLEIGGRPILWHILRHYAAHGFRTYAECWRARPQVCLKMPDLAIEGSRSDISSHNAGDPMLFCPPVTWRLGRSAIAIQEPAANRQSFRKCE